MDYPNLSGHDFKRIINLFKFITLGITALVSIALIVSYKDFASMRENLRKEITIMKQYSQTEIKNAQDYSIRQINLIREEALIQAKLSASLKVQEIFQNNKEIIKVIEETAEKKLYDKLNEILDKQLLETEEVIKEQIQLIPSLISAADRIRHGSRESLEYVDSLRLKAKRNSIKTLAESIFQLKKDDYLNAHS